MLNKPEPLNTKFNTKFYKQKILYLLRNDKEVLARELIKHIAKKEYIENNNIPWLYYFFSPIFDELFYEIIFKKIHITNSTKVLLERLALPLEKLANKERNKIICKIK